MFKRVVETQMVCLRALGKNRNGEVAFGRFLRNARVSMEEMLAHAARRLEGLCRGGEHVLAIQDTTEVNYQAHRQRTSGLGTVGNGTDAGFFLHPVIAVSAESNALLVYCQAHSRGFS